MYLGQGREGMGWEALPRQTKREISHLHRNPLLRAPSRDEWRAPAELHPFTQFTRSGCPCSVFTLGGWVTPPRANVPILAPQIPIGGECEDEAEHWRQYREDPKEGEDVEPVPFPFAPIPVVGVEVLPFLAVVGCVVRCLSVL